MNTTLTIYRAEDEHYLGLLEAREAAHPDTLDRADADAAIDRYLQSITVQARVDVACSVLAGLDAQIQGAETEGMRLRQRRSTLEGLKAKTEQVLLCNMADLGKKRLIGTIGSLRQQANPPSVQFTNESLVPDEYRTLHIKATVDIWKEIKDLLTVTGNEKLLDHVTTDTPEPSRSLIATTLKAHGHVPGAFQEQAIRLVRE